MDRKGFKKIPRAFKPFGLTMAEHLSIFGCIPILTDLRLITPVGLS